MAASGAMTRRSVLPHLSVLIAIACRPTDTAPPVPTEPETRDEAPPPTGITPEDELAELEAELIAGEYRLEYAIVAEGAIAATVTGLLVVTEDGVQLRAQGRLAERPLAVEFTADGERMRGKSGERSFDLPHADALREALAVGLTRMGLLHNIAVLGRGRPPDRADGGVQEWARARALGRERRVTTIATDEALPERRLSMDVVVNGTPAARATLWLDGDGLPLERHQVVTFPEGEMRVRERYAWL